MKTHFRSLGRAYLTVALAILGAGFSLQPAFGQMGSGVPGGVPLKKTFTNKTFFHLPIDIDKSARNSVREVILFVKEGTGGWFKKETAPATQTHFTYQVTRDAEYWFSVVTVDKMGRSNPVDVSKEPPALVVVVDTQAPTVELAPVNLPNNEMALRCTVRDANPDYQKLQVAYQGAGQPLQSLEPMPGQPGMFRLPNVPVLNGMVRYTAADRAGNQTTQEVVLKEQVTQNAPPPALPFNKGMGQQPGADPKPVPPPLPNADLQLTKHLPPSIAPETKTVTPPPVPTVPMLPEVKQNISETPVQNVNPYPPANPVQPMVNPMGNPVQPMVNPMPNPVQPPVSPYPTAPMEVTKTMPKTALVTGNGGRHLVNTQHSIIDYRLDKVGPSGVGKVDIWVKGENSGAWQHLATDADRKTPVEVQLPYEGLFGIRLAVTNGNGFGGNPPQPGDQPAFWIEVDTTPPFAQMQPVGPVSGNGTIDLQWTATDKNMGQDAISLYFATQKNGPWQPIARNLKNTGQFSWQFPREMAQFYVRLEVTDEAGNITRSELPTPIMLDLSEPQAQVVGVTGVSVTPK